ncbi:MAG: flagellar hook-basal body complex protein FliE, partial [Bacteroidota bacterium]
MKIEGLGDFLPDSIQPAKNKQIGGENFSNTLNDLIKDVNQNQINSEKTVENFVTGKGVELHEVMIASEKAKTSLELLMEVRNRAVDMYKELT